MYNIDGKSKRKIQSIWRNLSLIKMVLNSIRIIVEKKKKPVQKCLCIRLSIVFSFFFLFIIRRTFTLYRILVQIRLKSRAITPFQWTIFAEINHDHWSPFIDFFYFCFFWNSKQKTKMMENLGRLLDTITRIV